ncbi:MAG: hypothetical protein IPM64_00695 [Phycisphaerales bacterium]|nr:hypothetical protein [Phycisphaerales bacterium]
MTAFWRILLLVVLTRCAVWIAAYAGAAARVEHEARLPAPRTCFDVELRSLSPNDEVSPDLRDRVAAARAVHLRSFAPLLRWDAGHYLSIVEHGYRPPAPDGAPVAGATNGANEIELGAGGTNEVGAGGANEVGAGGANEVGAGGAPRGGGGRARVEQQSNIVFFPLYPLLSAGIGAWVGPRLGMVLVANAAALAAAVVMFWWLRRSFGEKCAAGAVLIAFCWPTSAFWSFGYAESLTLLLIVGALAAMECGRPWSAAGLCALATAARPTAIVAAVVLGLAAMVRRGATVRGAADSPARRVRRGLLVAALSAAGLVAWLGWLAWTTGSLTVYPRTLQAGWFGDQGPQRWSSFVLGTRVWGQFKYIGRALRDFPENLGLLASPLTWQMPLSLLLIAAGAVVWRRVGGSAVRGLDCSDSAAECAKGVSDCSASAAECAKGASDCSARKSGCSAGGSEDSARVWRVFLLTAPLIFLMRYAQSGWSDFGLESMGRYVGLAAPAFAAVAILLAGAPRWVRGLVPAMLMIGQMALAYRFGFGGWCG